MALKKPKIIRIQVRLPREVHADLKEAAKLEHISINSYLVRTGGAAARRAVQKDRQKGLFQELVEEVSEGARNPRTNSQKGKD
jgi:uncharacterized protein (DUF1778 family)